MTHAYEGDPDLRGRDRSEVVRAQICRFLGIVISMYLSDHNPPHFHVRYNEYRAVIDIYTLNILDGYLPGRVRGLVQEWAEIH